MIHDPSILVECDYCGNAEEFGMTALSCKSWDCRGLLQNIISEGWGIDGDNHYCSEACKNEAKIFDSSVVGSI